MRNSYDIFFDSENDVYQVRTKGDVVIIKFTDNEKEDIFNQILDFYDEKDFFSYSQIKKELSQKYADDKIIDVIRELIQCSLLNRENFGEENFSFEEIGRASSEYSIDYSIIENKKLGYIGENELGHKLEETATLYAYSDFEKLEAKEGLKDKKIIKVINESDFLIVDLSQWGPYHIDLINQTALELNKPWLLIEGMVDGVNFSIGPIFHGKQTGCYDCYSKRIRSNDEFDSYTQAYEDYLRQKKRFAKPDKVPILIKQYIASIVIMDISKYIGEWFVPQTWRTMLLFNTNSYDVAKHDFLRAPICYTCKPELDYSPSPWFETVTLNND